MVLVTRLLFPVFVFMTQILLSVDFHDFDTYQWKLTNKEIDRKLHNWSKKWC
jgi:hypothetical protein